MAPESAADTRTRLAIERAIARNYGSTTNPKPLAELDSVQLQHLLEDEAAGRSEWIREDEEFVDQMTIDGERVDVEMTKFIGYVLDESRENEAREYAALIQEDPHGIIATDHRRPAPTYSESALRRFREIASSRELDTEALLDLVRRRGRRRDSEVPDLAAFGRIVNELTDTFTIQQIAKDIGVPTRTIERYVAAARG